MACSIITFILLRTASYAPQASRASSKVGFWQLRQPVRGKRVPRFELRF
jgi:hypothetical protein